MRIVSLMPSATEILCALGLAESLVGISHECDFPAEILHRPRLTRTQLPPELSTGEVHRRVQDHLARGESLYKIDAERLAALAPDLVVSQRQCSVCALGESDAAGALAKAGSRARLLALAASRFNELPQDIRRLGEATDCAERAEALLEQLKRRLERVRRQTSGAHRPRVFCLSWFDPVMVAGHWVTEMVELAGGQDTLGARGETSTRIDPATLEAYAPDVIVLLPCGFTQARTSAEWEAVRDHSPWAKLPAVQAGRVYAAEGNLFHRPGPRLVDGVESLAALLHPERCGQSRNQMLARRAA